MHVATFLSARLLTHLRLALGRSHTVLAARSWGGFEHYARTSPVDVAVVEPCAFGDDRSADVSGFMQRHPSLPLVVYASISPAAMKATAAVARYGVRQVVLYGYDDAPARLRETIEAQPTNALASRLLTALRPQLDLLPAPVRGAVTIAISAPARFHHAPDLCAASGVTLRTVYRHLAAAGLGSPRRIVTAARLLRAFSYMREPGHSLEDVSAKLGYRRPRYLAANMREAVGATPQSFRAWMTPEEFVGRLAAWIRGSGLFPADAFGARG